MHLNELLAIAERDGLKTRFGPHLPVPTPPRWAFLSEVSAHCVWIVEPEREARRRAALDLRRRLFVVDVTLRMQRGPDVRRSLRVRATSAAVAARDALVQMRSVIGRRRVRGHVLSIVRG